MKKPLAILLISAILSPYLASQEVFVIAQIVTSSGEVKIRSLSGATLPSAKKGAAISSGDVIDVGKDSYCVASFLDDGSILIVKESTRLQVIDTENTRTLGMEFGKILSDVKKDKKKNFRVETPVSVASVKGTQFWSVINRMGFDKFYGLEGMVDVFNAVSGQSVVLGPGEMTLSTATGQVLTSSADLDEIPTSLDIPGARKLLSENRQPINWPEVPALKSSGNNRSINVAVLEFEGNNISSGEVRALTDRLRNELVTIGQFTIIERGKMDEVLKEQAFQQTGCVSSECAVEVGKLLGVENIITGSISKVGNVFSVSARVVDVESGEIVRASTYDHKGEIGDLLTDGMDIIAGRLLYLVEKNEGFTETITTQIPTPTPKQVTKTPAQNSRSTSDTLYVGEKFVYPVEPSSGTMISFEAVSLPNGASFDPSSKVITWTPIFSQVGVHQIEFQMTVEDSGGRPVVNAVRGLRDTIRSSTRVESVLFTVRVME